MTASDRGVEVEAVALAAVGRGPPAAVERLVPETRGRGGRLAGVEQEGAGQVRELVASEGTEGSQDRRRGQRFGGSGGGVLEHLARHPSVGHWRSGGDRGGVTGGGVDELLAERRVGQE